MNLRAVARALRIDRLVIRLRRVPGAGHARMLPFYRRLYRLSVRGMGYGASDWVDSGEAALLARISRERPGVTTVFDVGANVGGWACDAHAAWPGATIHAFEPSASTYAKLVSNVSGLSVRTVNAALSNESGEAVLHAVSGLSGLSSLHLRDLAAHDMTMTASETVQLMRLDDYAKEQGITHIDFLKIDAEGHELSVLQGAQGMIAAGEIDFIQFEFGGTCIDSRVFLRDFVRFLEPHYDLARVLVDAVAPLRYDEYEEIFSTCNFLATRRS